MRKSGTFGFSDPLHFAAVRGQDAKLATVYVNKLFC